MVMSEANPVMAGLSKTSGGYEAIYSQNLNMSHGSNRSYLKSYLSKKYSSVDRKKPRNFQGLYEHTRHESQVHKEIKQTLKLGDPCAAVPSHFKN